MIRNLIAQVEKFSNFSKFFVTSLLVASSILGLTVMESNIAFARGSSSGQPAGASDLSANLETQMTSIEAAIKQGVQGASAKYKSVSDPDSVLHKLPPKETVLKTKDVAKFLEFGGLSEVYLFNGKVAQAESLRSWMEANAVAIIGADDPTPGLLESDFALFYYDQGNKAKAEPLFKSSVSKLEAAMSNHAGQVRNNLISAYAGLAELAWAKGKKDEAQRLVDKIGNLAPAQ